MSKQRKSVFIAICGVSTLFTIMLLLSPISSEANGKWPKFKRTPFQFSFAESWDPGRLVTETYTVPENQQLVIEFASAYVDINNGDVPVISIETSVDSEVSKHFLALSKAGSLTLYHGDIFLAADKMQVFADPGTTITITAWPVSDCSNGTCGHFRFDIALSGYMQRVPKNR